MIEQPSVMYHHSWSTNCTSLCAIIQYKVLALVLMSRLGLAPKYRRNLVHRPLSASSRVHLLRSLDRAWLQPPQARTAIAQTRSFAIFTPSLWNAFLSTRLISRPLSRNPMRSQTPRNLETPQIFFWLRPWVTITDDATLNYKDNWWLKSTA